MKRADPPETNISVLIPASLPESSRSSPINAPRIMATTSCKIICEKVSIDLV